MTTKTEAEERARSIVNKWSAGAVAVSWVPGSALVLGAADYAMINAVAEAFQVKDFSMEQAIGVVAASATGLGLSEFLSFVPVAGWIVKAGIAGSVTKAMGEAVIAYFRDRSPLT
jgi:uncharacterized protein (DUF697 family)